MKSEDIDRALEVMHQVKPDELSGESKNLFNAIMQIADERDEAIAHNVELMTFIRDMRIDKEYSEWRINK